MPPEGTFVTDFEVDGRAAKMKKTSPDHRTRVQSMRSRVLLCALVWLLSSGCPDPAVDAGPLNVVLIVLDAARSDYFGIYGYDRDTTPVIDAFAAESTRYETVVSEASYTFTFHELPAVGRVASGHGSR